MECVRTRKINNFINRALRDLLNTVWWAEGKQTLVMHSWISLIRGLRGGFIRLPKVRHGNFSPRKRSGRLYPQGCRYMSRSTARSTSLLFCYFSAIYQDRALGWVFISTWVADLFDSLHICTYRERMNSFGTFRGRCSHVSRRISCRCVSAPRGTDLAIRWHRDRWGNSPRPSISSMAYPAGLVLAVPIPIMGEKSFCGLGSL